MAMMKYDVLIPVHEKDFESLNLCLSGIKKNIVNLNKIFVVSNKNPNIDGIVYVSEEKYNLYINIEKIIDNFNNYNPSLTYRSGWIYQQLLKLLSGKVISELSDSYLVVDSDTIFLNPISFNCEKFYYCTANEYHIPYISTIKKILNIKTTIGFSTICHHMFFNKKILNEMVDDIGKKSCTDSFFDCILNSIDYNEISSLSEWDLYSNYMILNHPNICENRQLTWCDISYIPDEFSLKKLSETFDFISCHAYLRNNYIR